MNSFAAADAMAGSDSLLLDTPCENSFTKVSGMSPSTMPYAAARRSVMVRTTLASTVITADYEGIQNASNFLKQFYAANSKQAGINPKINCDILEDGALERTPAIVYGSVLHYFMNYSSVVAADHADLANEIKDEPIRSSFQEVLEHPLLLSTSAMFLDAEELEDEQFMAHFRLIGILQTLMHELEVKVPRVNDPASVSKEITPVVSKPQGESADVVCCEAVERYELARRRLEEVDNVLSAVVSVLCNDEGTNRVHKIRKLIGPHITKKSERRIR